MPPSNAVDASSEVDLEKDLRGRDSDSLKFRCDVPTILIG